MKTRDRRLKRALDLAVSVPALVAASPLIVGCALAVRLDMGSPCFFRQERPGLNGRPFELVKMRTMKTPEQVGTEDDAARLTRLGQVLRRTSLDELPTLWNVVRGDMSLVGPRPLLMSYLPLYSAEQARRHDVPPGLTGLAQIRGRNALSWDQKFALDLEYVDNWSVGLDLKILCDTAAVVLRRSGISHASSATMPRFTGSAGGGA